MSQIKKTKQFLETLKFVQSLDHYGNVPYFVNSVTKSLSNLFSKDKLDVVEDEFALYLKVGNQKLPPVLVDTHLDHPGFTITEDNTVHSLGSFLNSKMLNKIKFPEKLPVSFYSPAGYYVTSGNLYKITTSNSQIRAFYQTDNNLTLPVNTQVMPQVTTGLEKDLLKLRSADNLSTVFVCLRLIESLKNKNNINLTFIFSKLEEIFQLSATGISKRGSTPFEKINNNTPIIVLEVAPVLTRVQAQSGDLAVASKENIFNTLNSNSKTLATLKSVCLENNTKLHYTRLNSHGNSISYRLVAGNTETICLHAGNFNRHNIDDEGNIAAEEVYLKSLINLEKVVSNLIKRLSADYPSPAQKLVFLPEETSKRNQLLSAYTRAYPRLKLNKLYPKSLIEYLYFGHYSLLSKLFNFSK